MPPKARETKVTTPGERLWCGKGGTKTFKIGNQVSTNARGSHIAFRAQELEISDPKVLLLEWRPYPRLLSFWLIPKPGSLTPSKHTDTHSSRSHTWQARHQRTRLLACTPKILLMFIRWCSAGPIFYILEISLSYSQRNRSKYRNRYLQD